MSRGDKDYFLTRAERERSLASEASDEIVGQIHLQLARAYEARVSNQKSAQARRRQKKTDVGKEED